MPRRALPDQRLIAKEWNSVTYPIVKREIAEALEADTAVIGG